MRWEVAPVTPSLIDAEPIQEMAGMTPLKSVALFSVPAITMYQMIQQRFLRSPKC